MKSQECVLFVKSELESVHINDYMEAEWLVALALDKKISDLYTDFELSSWDEQKVRNVLTERKKGRPLAYIIGNSEFFGRLFDVVDGVLIPRPETELLVEQVAKLARERNSESILEIGTGSGVIAVTLALETNASVTAVDISDVAVSVAHRNSQKLGANVEILKSDLFENVEGKFDIIVSNPPYIKTKVIETLETEVKSFEPMLALDGGEDGLDFYRAIINESVDFLNDNGIIAFEIGFDQGEDIKNLLQRDFEDIRILKDYNNHDRIVIAKKR